MSRHEDFSGPWWRYPVLRNALVSGTITTVAFVLAHAGWISGLLENALYAVAIPIGASHWAWEALEGVIERRRVGIDVLMLAAGVGSCLLGLLDEAAFLAFLYGAAEGLEEFTYARTRSAIRGLLDLAPKQATLLRDGREVTIAAEDLTRSDRFLVRPGESFPTDGVVTSGLSSVDESALTGESIPVDKAAGDKVFAGTMNRQGALEIEATAGFRDNSLSRVIHLVEEAQEQKGRTQQWIERFGRRYSPAVLVAAIGLVLVPWVLGLDTAAWAVRSVVLLVAAAPCALVMSMPVAMAAGITRAGKHGILIKGGVHLEHLSRVRAVAFDKTGTLTRHKPVVTEIRSVNGEPEDLLRLAAAVERYSEHPLAQAIVESAREKGLDVPPATGFVSLTGAGAQAAVDGRILTIGSPDLFHEKEIPFDDLARDIAAAQDRGQTVVMVAATGALQGFLAIEDQVRDGAAALIQRLRRHGLHVAILTGDNERTARAVADRVGVDEVFAHLKPEDKVSVVRSLRERFGTVLMVGDGVNDAPALAAATCGVAMGAVGSDAAIEAADVALMADDLGKLEEAIEIGERVQRISRQNVIFSLLILATLIPAALLGLLSVTAAVATHEASELLAVANGLRARS